MQFFPTEHFRRDLISLPRGVQKQIEKQLSLLLRNPRHPSLGMKKLSGYTEIWEIRMTRGYRLTLMIENELYVLRRVGTHDILRTP